MRVKTFAEACKVLKLKPLKVLPDVSKLPVRNQKAQIAYAKLLIIAEALNEGWEPDWDNYNQGKYFPWFYLNAPGFRFFGSGSGYSYSVTSGGSRLCFRSRELSDYAGKKFLSLWKDMMVLPKKTKAKK